MKKLIFVTMLLIAILPLLASLAFDEPVPLYDFDNYELSTQKICPNGNQVLLFEQSNKGIRNNYMQIYSPENEALLAESVLIEPQGIIGDIGCYSFHDTKNYTMGEGGAIIINNEKFIERAEIIREKGTDRTKFFRGEVDKYTWVDIGSSYLPSDINAAYLYGQLEIVDEINKNRLDTWNNYYKNLKNIKEIELPTIPEYAVHNGHMFYIKLDSHKIRNDIMNYLRENGIYSVFHYIPLHSAKAGENYGEFIGEDRYTTVESEKLLRLPMYYGLEKEDVIYICNKIREYFKI